MKIEVSRQLVNTTSQEIYDFLMDSNNFMELFPQDKITNWESTQTTCSMQVKNMGVLGLKRVASKSNALIYFDSFGKTPFKFTFNVFLAELGSNCNTKIVVEGDVNPFMKMMIEKPLSEFLNEMVERLVQINT